MKNLAFACPSIPGLRERLKHHEARSGVVSCAIFSGCGIILFLLLTLAGPVADTKSFHVLRAVFQDSRSC